MEHINVEEFLHNAGAMPLNFENLVENGCSTYDMYILKKKTELNPDGMITEMDCLIEKLIKERLTNQQIRNTYVLMDFMARCMPQQPGLFKQEIIFTACIDMVAAEERGDEELQQAVSNILVHMSKDYYRPIMRQLQFQLHPANPFICSVLHTIAGVVSNNEACSMPLLDYILLYLYQRVELAQDAMIKKAFCSALQSLSQCLFVQTDCGINLQAGFKMILLEFFIIFSTIWIEDTNREVEEAVIKAIRPMVRLLPEDDIERSLTYVLPRILCRCNSNIHSLYITQTLQSMLDVAVSHSIPFLSIKENLIFSTLFTQSLFPLEAPISEDHMQVFHEHIKCFAYLGNHNLMHVVGYLIIKLKEEDERACLTALIILREMFQANPSAMKTHVLMSAILSVNFEHSSLIQKERAHLMTTMGAYQLLRQRDTDINEHIIQQIINADNIMEISNYMDEDTTVDFIKMIICLIISQDQLKSSKASIFLSNFLSQRHHFLQKQISNIFHLITNQSNIRHKYAKDNMLRVMCVLTKYHPGHVIEDLLMSLSYNRNACLVWQSMTDSSETTQRMLTLLMEYMDQDTEPDPVISINDKSIKIILGIQEIIRLVKEPEWIKPQISSVFCRLLKYLILTTASNFEVPEAVVRRKYQPRNPYIVAMAALETLLKHNNKEGDNPEQKKLFQVLQCPREFYKGISLLTRYFVQTEDQMDEVNRIIKDLLPHLQSASSARSIACTALFSELLSYQSFLEKNMQKILVETMIGKVQNTNATMRCVAIKALGNATQGASKYVTKYKHLFMDALVKGLYDPVEECVIEESLVSLSKVIKLMKPKELGNKLIDVLLQCRVFLNDENQTIQLNTTLLVGELARYGRVKKNGLLEEQLRSCIHSLLEKLHSPSLQIVAATMYTIYHCAPHLGCHHIQCQLKAQFIYQADSQHLNNICAILTMAASN